ERRKIDEYEKTK
ncbi:Hypothetical protein EIN_056210, partial [Entamoeba invadens IP1]